jgi:hypothetical protein
MKSFKKIKKQFTFRKLTAKVKPNQFNNEPITNTKFKEDREFYSLLGKVGFLLIRQTFVLQANRAGPFKLTK